MTNQTMRTTSDGTDRLSKRRFYRRLTVGLLAGGVGLGLLLREVLGYPLAGEAVYWTGVVGALAVLFGSPVSLFDERDRSIERTASQITLTVAGVVLVLGASAARVATYTGTYDVPTEVSAVLWGYVGLFAVFAVVYGWIRYRG